MQALADGRGDDDAGAPGRGLGVCGGRDLEADQERLDAPALEAANEVGHAGCCEVGVEAA